MNSLSSLLARTVPTGDCLIWQGARNSKGYGCVTDGHGRSMLAHRKVWREQRGRIPTGLTIDHLCRNKLCLNVDHMEVVTRAENSRRKNEAQTHCKRGHLLSGETIRLHTRANGLTYRVCRLCEVARRELNAFTTERKSA